MFEIFEESTAQKEKFRIAANRLLNQCFLLKKKEETRKDYVYVRENRAEFAAYFDLLGYELKINEDQGVIGLYNTFGTGRLSLTKYESILLLILRLLYIEKRREISNAYEEVTVLMEEIRERYQVLKLKTKPVMDKQTERNMVALFRRYNLIRNLDSDVTKAETRILIYPSILMAVTVEDIDAFYAMSEKKLKEYADSREDDAEGDEEE